MVKQRSAERAMRSLLRASWWIAVLLLAVLPLVSVMVTGLTLPEVAVLDLIVLVIMGLVLACSAQARAGLRIMPMLVMRPRRRHAGLTAAHVTL